MIDLYLNSVYQLFIRQTPLRKALSEFLLNVRDFLLWPAKKQQMMVKTYQIEMRYQQIEQLLQPAAVKQVRKLNVKR